MCIYVIETFMSVYIWMCRVFRGSGVECVQADVIIQESVSVFKTSVTEDCQDIRLYKWMDILYNLRPKLRKTLFILLPSFKLESIVA